MSEFNVTASLQAVVDESSLRTAEQTIADRLGNVTVDVDTGAGASTPAADGGTASQSLARSAGNTGPSVTGGTSAAEPEGLSDILTAQLEVQESLLEAVEDINGGGGGLFGEGGILSLVSETAVSAGGEVAGTTGEVLASAVGPAVGSAIGSVLPGLLGQDDSGGPGVSGSVSLQRPDWVPLAVEDPGTVSVEDAGDVAVDLTRPQWLPLQVSEPSEVPVEDLDTIPVEDVTPLGVNDPSPLGVESVTLSVEQPTLGVNDPSPLGVSDPSPLSVESVEPIPVNAPESIPVTVSVAPGGGDGFGLPIGPPAIPALLGREGARAESKDPADRNIVEEVLAELTPKLGRRSAATSVALEAVDTRSDPGGSDRPTRRRNETKVEITTNVEGTGGISEREAERIAERKAEEVRREIERKIGRGRR